MAPTLTPAYLSPWTTTNPKASDSITVSAGDVLVVMAGGSSSNGTLSVSDSQGLTWTGTSLTQSSYSPVYLWTSSAVPSGVTSLTVAVARASGSSYFGFVLLRGMAVSGVGTPVTGSGTSGGPSLSLTTGAANSAIAYISSDYNSNSVSGRTWRQANGSNPVEDYVATPSSSYYIAHYSDAGAAGSKTTGLSAPTGQKWQAIAVELRAETLVGGSYSPAWDVEAYVGGSYSPRWDVAELTVGGSYSPAWDVEAFVGGSYSPAWDVLSFGTWHEQRLTSQWLDGMAAPDLTVRAWGELVDLDGNSVTVTVNGEARDRLPLSGASVTFRGEQPEQWSATLAYADPWMVPASPAHPLWGIHNWRIRLWWGALIAGVWLDMPVCTLAIGNSDGTNNGLISGTVRGRDVLSTMRNAYGATLDIAGMGYDEAIRAIFDRCAPWLPVRIAPTTGTVPDNASPLGENDPLSDALELAAIAYSNGTVRSDREGVIVVGPRPEPAGPVLDWQEGGPCSPAEIEWAHGIEHMGNTITVVCTHADYVGLYVVVDDDDPASPTWVEGPWGRHPLATIRTDKTTTVEGLRNLGRAALGKGVRPTLDLTVTTTQRPDLDYRHPVRLDDALLGVTDLWRVSSYDITLPVDDREDPQPMKVGMMQRYR